MKCRWETAWNHNILFWKGRNCWCNTRGGKRYFDVQMEENPVVQELTSVVVAAAASATTEKTSSWERRQQGGGALRQKRHFGRVVRNQEAKGQPTEWIDSNDFLWCVHYYVPY